MSQQAKGVNQVKQLVAVIAGAALVFALIAPAQAQPFADVPTNHWAYDAIAELAAKGLIEGYPDGTFKGDRAMTRYEMAIVVARLLARIESIQIPAPQGPQVTRADLEAIQRLVNEFRQELTALGVRVTALEEEMNAIKARLDNVRVTGAYRFRYDSQRTASDGPVNGNPTTGSTDASRSPQLGFARQTLKLSFDGTVTREVHFILSLLSNGNSAVGGGQWQTINSSAFGLSTQAVLASIDNAFFDWKNAFGLPLEIWLGRFGGTSPPGATYPVQFGPFGLLMNTGGDTWEDATSDSGFNVVDGLRIAGRFKDLADLQVQGVILRVAGGAGATTYAYGEDAYGIDANVRLMDGLRAGAYYVGNSILLPGAPVAGATNALWHVYGPGGGSMNPATTNCPTVAGAGIQCAASGSGGGGYIQWDITEGIHLDGEYAQWNDAVHRISDTGWQVNLTWDLDALLHTGHGLTLQTGYLNFGQNFYPPYGGAEADIAMADVIYPGNAQGFTLMLTFNPAARWTVYGTYAGGNFISNSQPFTQYEAGAKWAFANNADITFLVRDLRINNVEQLLLYRAEVDYQF